MGRATGISWTRSTRNFWSGCTKIGPGCDGCYAEAFNRFTKGKNEATGQAMNWGPGAPRVPHLEGAAKDLRKWNGIALHERETGRVVAKDWNRGWKHAGFFPVFLNSHSDMFDNEVPQEWRDYAFSVIRDCKALDFLLVTKRIGNVAKMVPASWMSVGFPLHVRLLITIVNQEEAERDIPKLLALPTCNGISYEPALGPIDWSQWFGADDNTPFPYNAGLDWIIVGGESDQAGHVTRPFDLGWARGTVAQCRAAGVPVFVKQLGSRVQAQALNAPEGWAPITFKEPAGKDIAEWPVDLQVQEFPA
jgi:protein gp37